MTGQIDIFQILYPERISPIRQAAKRATPYWTTSAEKIARAVNEDLDIKTLANIVKHEYCPYGYASAYGIGEGPNTIFEYKLKTNLIEVGWRDATGNERINMYSWEDFAREIGDLVLSGEYNG